MDASQERTNEVSGELDNLLETWGTYRNNGLDDDNLEEDGEEHSTKDEIEEDRKENALGLDRLDDVIKNPS